MLRQIYEITRCSVHSSVKLQVSNQLEMQIPFMHRPKRLQSSKIVFVGGGASEAFIKFFNNFATEPLSEIDQSQC